MELSRYTIAYGFLSFIMTVLSLLGLILMKDLSTVQFWILLSMFITFLVCFVYILSKFLSNKCIGDNMMNISQTEEKLPRKPIKISVIPRQL